MSSESNLSSQIQFLILCCKSKMDEKDIKAIRENVTATKNLEEVSMLSYDHGIYPLFYHALIEHASDLMDQEMKDAMAYLFQNIKATNEMMTDELVHVTRLLEEHDIEVLSFKGPVLAEIAYGDISLRQYRDLDILVHRQHVYKAGLLLTDNHYVSKKSLAFFKNKAMLDINSDLTLLNTKNQIILEIHWKLFWQFYQIRFEAEDIWKSSYFCNIQNHQIKTLSPELLLPYLCAHGSKHQWERIEWLVDIDRLIRSNTEMDWERIIHIANQSHTMTQLLLGLSLINELFRTPIIEEIDNQFTNKKIVSLKNEILIFLTEGVEQRGYFYHLQLQDTFQDKCLFTWSSFVKPTPSDVETIDIPDYLSFVYYFIKFYRVLKKIPKYFIRKYHSVFP